MECISSASFLVLINGVPEGYFNGKRGLREGDPISPYIFVLCMEILSRKLSDMAKNPRFSFHPKCKAVGLVHLAFADDLLIFCKGDIESVSMVKQCVDVFIEASGLTSNPDKSHCFLAGMNEERKEEILVKLGVKEGRLPVRYLRCPLHSARIKNSNYDQIIVKIQKVI